MARLLDAHGSAPWLGDPMGWCVNVLGVGFRLVRCDKVLCSCAFVGLLLA